MEMQRQLEELQALRAMYPEDEGCFILAPAEQEALAAAAAGATLSPVRGTINLSGTIKLPGVLLEQQPVSLRFQLPPGYPSAEPPQLSVECSATRPAHEQLSRVVRQAAGEAVGTESLLVVLAALQEAVEEAAATAAQQPSDGSNHCHTGRATQAEAAAGGPQQPTGGAQALPAAAQGASTSSAATTTMAECPNDVLQVVLWMHHIKSTQKRKDLVGWARELDCYGFSKPGFPGVVVVEGAAPDVREYVARVRALQWQAIQVRAERLTHCAACSQGGVADGTAAASRAFAGRFTELPETGLSQLSQECKAAGMEDLFCAALKLERKG